MDKMTALLMNHLTGANLAKALASYYAWHTVVTRGAPLVAAAVAVPVCAAAVAITHLLTRRSR